MSKKLFLMTLSIFLLVGCSEELEQSVNEEVARNSTESVNNQQDEETITAEESAEVTESDIQTSTSSVVTGSNENQGSLENKVEKSNEESSGHTDEKKDYYNFYVTNAIEKSTASSEQDTSEDEQFVYEQMTEDIIQMPILSDNEKVFENQVETISLSDLEEIDVVTYVEEPLTKGYLIDFNLLVLNNHYAATSYSFKYKDVEYGIMVSEDTPESGFVFIRDVEGLLEDIKENGVFNILK